MCIMYHGYLLSFCPSNDASFWMSPGSNPSLSGNIIALVGISKSLQPVFSFMVTSKSVQRPRSVTTKPSACPITNFALAAEEAADPPWHGTRLPDRVTQCHICHYVSYFFNMCFWSLIRHDKFARLSDAYLFLCSRPSWQMKAFKSTTTFKPPDLLVAASCKETPIKWTELYIYLRTLKIQTRQKPDAINFNRSMESAAMSTNQDALDVSHTMMKNRITLLRAMATSPLLMHVW